MILTSFSVTNFRSITSAHKINLHNKTVLIGQNNEGKTNLLRALQTAMDLLQQHARPERLGARLGYREVESYVWRRDFPIQLQSRKSSKQTIFKLDFSLNESECQDFKSEIGSNLNGSLPLEVRIGDDGKSIFRLVKPGKFTSALTKKSPQIAKFVASRIHFNYIPAVRTDGSTIELISGMLSQELRDLEGNEDYIRALNTIAELQKPVLEELAQRVQGPLKEFLPSIKSVQIEISEASRRFSLRRDVSVIVDDGTPTSLEHKGDGVKSLAALGLLKSRNTKVGASILAIEEPESHLHPAAIHQVNEIIRSISENSQVIITTHNPLFVDRSSVRSNIIVSNGAATAAKSISSIRDLLGIKASDNLTHANFALVVEGEEDAIALRSLLPFLSDKVGKALKSNSLIIEPIGGAGNLSYKLSLLKNFLCVCHVLLDDDDAGRGAYAKAEKDGLVTVANCTFTKCHGSPEAEFEDCIEASVYKGLFLEKMGVDLDVPKFRGSKKWSQRLKAAFDDQGKIYTGQIETDAKYLVSTAIAKNPQNSLNPHKRNSIDSLVSSIERMIFGAGQTGV